MCACVICEVEISVCDESFGAASSALPQVLRCCRVFICRCHCLVGEVCRSELVFMYLPVGELNVFRQRAME